MVTRDDSILFSSFYWPFIYLNISLKTLKYWLNLRIEWICGMSRYAKMYTHLNWHAFKETNTKRIQLIQSSFNHHSIISQLLYESIIVSMSKWQECKWLNQCRIESMQDSKNNAILVFMRTESNHDSDIQSNTDTIKYWLHDRIVLRKFQYKSFTKQLYWRWNHFWWNACTETLRHDFTQNVILFNQILDSHIL